MSPTTAFAPKPMTPASAQALGLALALLGAAFFATKGIVVKLALADGIDTMTTLTWRMIVSVPIFVLVGIVGYRRRIAAHPGQGPLLDRSTVLSTLGVGILGYYAMISMTLNIFGMLPPESEPLPFAEPKV